MQKYQSQGQLLNLETFGPPSTLYNDGPSLTFVSDFFVARSDAGISDLESGKLDVLGKSIGVHVSHTSAQFGVPVQCLGDLLKINHK